MTHRRFINLIVAYEKDTFLFGDKKTNDLPWKKLSKDLEHFKKITSGHVCIMGKNTYYSIPKKHRPLKNRVSIIVSKTMFHSGNGSGDGDDNVNKDAGKDASVIVCETLEQAIAKYEEMNSSSDGCSRKCFVIGGYEMFNEVVSLVETNKERIECIYATELTAIEHKLDKDNVNDPLYLPNGLIKIIETCSTTFTSDHYQFEQYHQQNEILYENGFIIEFKNFFVN